MKEIKSKEYEIMHHAIYRVLNSEYIEEGENNKLYIRPEYVSFTQDQWESLTSAPSAVDKIEEIIPELCTAYIEDIAESLLEQQEIETLLGESNLQTYVQDFLQTYCQMRVEKEVWLETPVRLDVGLTVDDWSDYMLNVTYPAYGWDGYEADFKGFFNESSIMWLTRRQGYKQADLRKAQHLVEKACDLPDPLTLIPSKYLYSAAMEIWHELSFSNQLGFFFKVPLREALLMQAMQDWGWVNKKWPGYILVSKDVHCGFYNSFLGSCSLIGIELEKDVKIPLNNVTAIPDGADGYSMYGVHGNPDVWNSGTILHYGFPRQFKRDAALYGFGKLP